MDFDSHIGDHIDDILDLFRVYDLIRQMFRHLVIGDKALFLAFGDQQF